MMKTAFFSFVLGISLALASSLTGCATQDSPTNGDLPAQEIESPAGQAGGPAKSVPADIDQLVAPVLSYHALTRAVEYFDHFSWGDEIFVEELFCAFALEAGRFEVGEGIELRAVGAFLEPMRLRRSLLELLPEGNAWWQIDIRSEQQEIIVEALIDPTGLPLRLRYIHPVTGHAHERIPLLADELSRAVDKMGREAAEAQLGEYLNERIDGLRRGVFANPEVVGLEEITVHAGTFSTVRITDRISGHLFDYWLDPGVPGGIVRISSPDPSGGDDYTVELASVAQGVQRSINEWELVEERFDESEALGSAGEYPSEGTPEEPEILSIGQLHYGSVEYEKRSYYAAYVPKRSDVSIQVSELSGSAELYYYGGDAEFARWLTASSGSTLDAQDYFVRGDSWLYFSVFDIADNDAGEGFVIEINLCHELHPMGVRMEGSIYWQAVELEAGRSHNLRVDAGNLVYLRSTVNEGSALRIEAESLPDDLRLKWFGVEEGGYSSVMERQIPGSPSIEVSGLETGATCYYYIVGEPGTAEEPREITLIVEVY